MNNYFSSASLFKQFEKHPFLEYLLVLSLVILVRLPYLTGEHLFFDGDEAVVGIMARDLSQFKAFPIYFYGQQYGFSFFEVLSAAIFIPFLGSTVYPIKLGAMLLLAFAFSVLLSAVRQKSNSLAPYFICLLLIVSYPVWIVWGTKLRGGYITSLIFFCLIAKQILTSDKWSLSQWIKIAVYAAFVAVSQVLFILPLLPILLWRFFEIKSAKNYLIIVATGITALIVLRIPAYFNEAIWTPDVFNDVYFSHYAKYTIQGFFSSFTNFGMYGDLYTVPKVLLLKCILFFVTLLAGLIAAFIFFEKSEKKCFCYFYWELSFLAFR